MKDKIIEILKRHGAIRIKEAESSVLASFPVKACRPTRKAREEILTLRNESGMPVRDCFLCNFSTMGLGDVRVCAVHF